MSCYHPLLGLWYGERTADGKKKYKIEGALDPTFLYHGTLDQVTIPCGQCIGCRLDYSRSWADRMMLELETAGCAVFVTLTYRNEDAPWTQFEANGNPEFASLDKRDCQLFMKRLREHFEDKKIRFYLAGEYGTKTFRPHYHAILFGLRLSDLPDLHVRGRNELGEIWYDSPLLASIWSHGHCVVCDVSYNTMAYVSRYVTKKMTGPAALQYAYRNQIPEFSLMSRKPGIGKPYLDAHPEILEFKYVHLGNGDGSKTIPIPKYFLNQLKLTDSERYDKIMEQRKEAAKDQMLLKLKNTGLSYLDYLEMEEEKRKSIVKVLKRK